MRKRTETRVSLCAQWLRGRKSPVRVNHLRPSDKSNLVRPCINVIFLGSLVSVLAPSIYNIAVYLSRRELWQFGLEVREARWQLGPRTHTLRAGHVEISRASCSHSARQSSSDIFFFYKTSSFTFGCWFSVTCSHCRSPPRTLSSDLHCTGNYFLLSN